MKMYIFYILTSTRSRESIARSRNNQAFNKFLLQFFLLTFDSTKNHITKSCLTSIHMLLGNFLQCRLSNPMPSLLFHKWVITTVATSTCLKKLRLRLHILQHFGPEYRKVSWARIVKARLQKNRNAIKNTSSQNPD